MTRRLKVLVADILSMAAAVVVLTAIVALPWLISAPWWLPTCGTSERWSYTPSLILYAVPLCAGLAGLGAIVYVPLCGFRCRSEAPARAARRRIEPTRPSNGHRDRHGMDAG